MTSNSSPGLLRFQIYTEPLRVLLGNAAASENPALFLYTNKARDILFRLEALARIYQDIHNKKTFSRLNEDFKELEDALGLVDYYDAFAISFSKENVPPAFLAYFTSGKEKALKKLNELLRKEKWLSADGKMNEINESLNKADWLSEKDDSKALAGFFVEEIEKFIRQYEKGKLHFDDIEEGVHEFRRKLRWFSIYPAALNGLIQLKKIPFTDESLRKYMTPEILASPFNVLPPPVYGDNTLYIEDQLFFALSWMISETGKLKDGGLRRIAIKNAMKKMEIAEDKSLEKLISEDATGTEKEICAKAKAIADIFIYKDMVPERMKRNLK